MVGVAFLFMPVMKTMKFYEYVNLISKNNFVEMFLE